MVKIPQSLGIFYLDNLWTVACMNQISQVCGILQQKTQVNIISCFLAKMKDFMHRNSWFILNNICFQYISEISGRDLIAGTRSFGALLEDEGYYAVPSPRQPFPGNVFFPDTAFLPSFRFYNQYQHWDNSNNLLIFVQVQISTTPVVI